MNVPDAMVLPSLRMVTIDLEDNVISAWSATPITRAMDLASPSFIVRSRFNSISKGWDSGPLEGSSESRTSPFSVGSDAMDSRSNDLLITSQNGLKLSNSMKYGPILPPKKKS